MKMSQRSKQDYQARRLNFYNLDEEADNSVIDLCLSSDEDGDECPTYDTFNDTPFINLDDTDTFSGTSLMESLLSFEPLLDHTIMYGEGLLQ